MIKPITIPAAGALDFGHGDVRHYAEGDALGVAELQTPTRMLAARDVMLATTLNEVVAALNNQEQYVPLPVMRTLLAPTSSEVVANYRIPAGFEARVLNAAVSATPPSSAVSLKVVYSPSFGSVTGVTGSTEVVSTTSETESGGVQFSPPGEFIITIANSGGESLEVVASVVLTMRPIGGSGGLLVGTPMQGEVGPVGATGVPGATGAAGVSIEGPPGKPGIYYRQAWVAAGSSTAAVFYNKNDAVTYAGSTYIALRDITEAESQTGSGEPNFNLADSGTHQWGFLAKAGTGTGSSGAAGPPGSSYFRVVPVAGTASVSTTPGDFDSLPDDGSYKGFRNSEPPAWYAANGGNNTLNFSLVEATISDDPSFLTGMAFLYGSGRVIMQGNVNLTLPVKTVGNSVDWGLEVAPGSDTFGSAINVTATLNGTAACFHSNGTLFSPAPWIEEVMLSTGTTATRPNGQQHTYVVRYSGTEPAKVDIMVFGVRQIT